MTAETADRWTVEHVGPEVPRAGDPDLVREAATRAVGKRRALRLMVHSEIPFAKGLGSSAAAAAAGYAAARRACGLSVDAHEVFADASRSDGHPENAGAAVFGGLVAAPPGRLPFRLEFDPELEVVLAVPALRLSTEVARASLPFEVSREVTVRTVARSLALVEGLRTGRRDLLEAAEGDEVHELPRHALNPQARDLMRAARDAGALHACWSGSGPSVLALTKSQQTPRVRMALLEGLGGSGAVLTPRIADSGLL